MTSLYTNSTWNQNLVLCSADLVGFVQRNSSHFSKGIEGARKFYDAERSVPPYKLDFHKTMIEVRESDHI